MLEKIRTWLERRSAAKAAEALYQFMVLNHHNIDEASSKILRQARTYCLSKSG